MTNSGTLLWVQLRRIFWSGYAEDGRVVRKAQEAA
jgi:hypothetical protein